MWSLEQFEKNQDISLLKRLQHFIVKHVQKLPKLTRSDICESLVGLNPITCEVEKRKLYLLRKAVLYEQ
jgi:hypothetical protein